VTTQEVLFGVTSQSLVLEVDRPLSAITSVTVWSIQADDTSPAESATTGSPAIDSATEATTAAAGASEDDPTLLTVASTAGFVAGRRYRISGAGHAETFELARIATGALYARHPLVNSYASGATIDATLRATQGLLDSWAADLTKLSPTANPNPTYRVKWVVTHADDSSVGVYFRNFDLVRYPSSPPVSPLDVDRADPGWLDRLPEDYRDDQGRALIVEATRDVRLDLWHRGIADQALRSGEAFAALVIARSILAAIEANARRGSDLAITAYPVAKDAYDRRLAGLVDSPTLALDKTGAGGATTLTGRSAPLTRR
jgi:hypothetical protein